VHHVDEADLEAEIFKEDTRSNLKKEHRPAIKIRAMTMKTMTMIKAMVVIISLETCECTFSRNWGSVRAWFH